MLIMTLHVITMTIVPSVPFIEGLVQTVEPVRCGGHIGDLLARDIGRYKLWNRMTDKHVGVFNVIPKVFPDIVLRRSRNSDEITSDLDMRSVQDRSVRCKLFDERNKPRHLRIVDLFWVSILCDGKF